MLKTPLANTFINRVLLKTLCLVLLPLCAVWAAVDALGQDHAVVPSRAHMELPTHWNGAPLRVLALSDVEQRFAHNFPGQIARLTDDRQVLVLRHVQRPTRMLHPAADCYKGLGYRIAHEQLQMDAQQQRASSAGRAGLAKILRGRSHVSWSQYKKIDAAETDRSRLRNDAQPREKFLTVDEMMEAAAGGSRGGSPP